jgi:hypothetical protein
VQADDAGEEAAVTRRVHVRLAPRIGEHLVAGTPLAWIWSASPEHPTATAETFGAALEAAVRIGFERIFEHVNRSAYILLLVGVSARREQPSSEQLRGAPIVTYAAKARSGAGTVFVRAGPASTNEHVSGRRLYIEP